MAADGSAEIRPQAGPQEQFLASSADIAIYGGAAGGGKTFALLLEPLRHCANPGFGAVIFRRESVQVTNEGGLWDTALSLYPLLGARPLASPKLQFKFPAGARVAFGHLNSEASVLDWQGSQLPFVGYDELTHFSRTQFFYMLSRNRSTCGVRPYIRATCNPDAESWVAEFIAWWIDQDTGYPIPERAGRIRWFIRRDEVLHWADDVAELCARFDCTPDDCKSVTFIPASLDDNPALLRKDPGYRANLMALSLVERERLLRGNWKIKPAAGLYFKRADARIVPDIPDDVLADTWVRGWDLAATEETEKNDDPDYTASVRMARRRNGRIVIAHAERFRKRSADVRARVRALARQDGGGRIVIPEDPGQAGKDQADSYVRELSGYAVIRVRSTTSKVTRAEPLAAQWQNGLVDVVAGPWNEAFFAEMEAFPDVNHDDQVDAASVAFLKLPPAGGSIATGGSREAA